MGECKLGRYTPVFDQKLESELVSTVKKATCGLTTTEVWRSSINRAKRTVPIHALMG